MFSATGMRPGQGVGGTVRIGNAGTVAARFSVRSVAVTDHPGPFGGRLSERVELGLFDITEKRRPRAVFAGRPADLEVDLGTFAAGEAREYMVAATLPDGSVGDNAVHGSGLTLGLAWHAGPAPAPAPKPTVTPTPVKPVDLAHALGLPPATRCVRRGRLKFTLTTPNGAGVKSATVAVNGRIRVRVKGARALRPISLKRLPKRMRLEVDVRGSDLRTYGFTPSYRACRP